MGFKKMRSVRLPYKKQGFIFFMCRNYDELPEKIQTAITTQCGLAAGEHAAALLALLTTGKSVSNIALQYHISESALYRYRKLFYESFENLF